jgi:hypothetical protein
MPSDQNLVKGLALIACGVGSGAAIRLYCQSLHKRYTLFFYFLCFNALRSFTLLAIGWWLPRPRNIYAYTWVLTEPLTWLFDILVVLELYTLVMQDYKGLQTAGRWVFFGALTLAVLISGASVLPTLSNPAETAQVIFYLVLIERGILFSLVLFILLILFFLSWFPVSLSRNVIIHAVVCSVFLISGSLGYLVRNVEGTSVTRTVNIANSAITIVCWFAWMMLLNQKGEGTRVVVRREFTTEDERRMVDQLVAINNSLMRTTDKKKLNNYESHR